MGGELQIGEAFCQICQMAVDGVAAFATRGRGTQRETCLDTAVDRLLHSSAQLQLAGGELDCSYGLLGSKASDHVGYPSDENAVPHSESHLLNPSESHVATPAGVVPTEGSTSQAAANLSSLTLDGNVLEKSGKDSEGVKSRALGHLEHLEMANGDAQEKLNPSPETGVTGVLSKLDWSPAELAAHGLETWQSNLEGCINAFSHEASELNLKLKSELHRFKHELQEQASDLSRKDEEVATLKAEGQTSRELITQLQSQAAELAEYLDMTSKIKAALGKDKIPASEIAETFVKLFRDKDRQLEELRKSSIDKDTLREAFRKSNAQLDHSKRDVAFKTAEVAELKTNAHMLEEANIKLEEKVEKIQKQLCQERSGYDGSYVDGLQTPFLLESTAKDLFSSIAAFSKLLSKYTDSHDNTARTFLSKDVYLTRDHHWTLLLKSKICNFLFNNFETEAFASSRNTALFLSHEDRASRCFEYFGRSNNKGVLNTAASDEGTRLFDSLFLSYFASVSPYILPPEVLPLCTYFTIEGDILGDAKDLLPEGVVQLNVVQSLIIAAKKVWDFHKLCLSFEPPATIFRVAIGEPFDENYMDSNVALEDDPKFAPKVGFMMYPGFRLRKSIIKCEVYFGVQT